MILVDSSVWIDHFRHDDPALSELLDKRQVLWTRNKRLRAIASRMSLDANQDH
ncbi:hypothetical protein [Sphingomonas sp.]|uniref:hypothetical protein n=1 Tax=Sphingomonas sp. TaxID=28214 RepID=UPI0025EAA56A|nr:hypothetical protein [Sphingomonas sp.]